jgi:hypothetical protein
MNSFNSFLNKAKEEFKALENTYAVENAAAVDPTKMQLQLVDELKRERAKNKTLQIEMEKLKAGSAAVSRSNSLDIVNPELIRIASPQLPYDGQLIRSTTPDLAESMSNPEESLAQLIITLRSELSIKDDTVSRLECNLKLNGNGSQQSLQEPGVAFVALQKCYKELEQKSSSLNYQVLFILIIV